MEPGRRLPRHGEAALLDAERGERRDRVGLGGEHIRLRRLAGPIAASALKRRTWPKRTPAAATN